MPASEQKINELNQAIQTLAATIQNAENSLTQEFSALETINEQIESERAAMMSAVANARFEVNNKLMYTNDDQRKSAVIELEKVNTDFAQMKITRRTKIENINNLKAAIEMNRNLIDAKKYEFEYFAKLP